ncbi:OsmC family protein [Ancylomarina sp. 16SWW S1-10-2]|uniref:OsmC family protein n=1 Tax=Ancylomarina sp. 16SWW S1-10-2 TaxID=2499681 RepID=UPI0012AE0F2F|nr:OsmC family protein [Ancylomarina sp. 16SWW S1-10-2]MRT92600.1 OsmC family peroxiredoxin [Ancylomarina sp. 16SWW S1-10-2]
MNTKKNRSRKSKITVSILAILLVIASIAAIIWFRMPSEQRNMVSFMMKSGANYDNYQEYQTIGRNKIAPQTTSFKPVVAKTTDDDYNSNVTVITEMVRNGKSKMLKKAMVQPNGTNGYLGWQLIADEGFEEGVNSFGPSPLSYLTSGIAANLHTQIIRAAKVLNIKLDNVKVEVLNKFHWDDMMSAKGAGFLDETHTNIIIESSESEEAIQNLKEIALNSWTAGEGLRNATTIKPSLIVNGKNWDNYRATPGTTLTDEAYVDGLKISHITDGAIKSNYIEQVAKGIGDQSMDDISNLVFEILAISESAENPDRPYLKKVTVSFNSAGSETWEVYSDEINGTDGIPMAPTSLEYVTAGTALCLTSQMTLVCAMLDLDFTDFRVEQQIDYREENVNSIEMAGFADVAHSSIMIESDESDERLNRFFQQSLSMCFAGEAFKGATDMYTHCYLNGKEID